MNKTKIFILTTTLTVFVVMAIVGASYAQTLNQQSYIPSPQAQNPTGINGAYGYGSYNCPMIGGTYTYGAPQSGYSNRMGMRGGMMGGYNR